MPESRPRGEEVPSFCCFTSEECTVQGIQQRVDMLQQSERHNANATRELLEKLNSSIERVHEKQRQKRETAYKKAMAAWKAINQVSEHTVPSVIRN